MGINKSLMTMLCISVLATGCASTSYIKDEDATKTYDLSVNDMMVVVPQAIEVAGMKVDDVDHANKVVKATAPPSFWTSSFGNMIAGGDDVEVRLKEISASMTEVFVTSFARATAIDYGRTARVVRSVYQHLDEVVNQRINSKG